MLLFDIGANSGKWAIANYSDNKIICVEASPTTFNSLVANVVNYKNITCINSAVCDSVDSEIEFFHSDADTISTLDRKWLDDPSSRFYKYSAFQSIMVPTVSIDALIRTYGTPDLLKIDVEGAENIAIRSLTSKAKTLCFEWASEWNNKNFECVRYLSTLGYSQFHIQFTDSYLYRPDAYEHTAESVITALGLTTSKVDWGMLWCK